MNTIRRSAIGKLWLFWGVLFLTLACSGDDLIDHSTLEQIPFDEEYGKQLMEPPPVGSGKQDGNLGIKGPRDIFSGGSSEVWEVENDWEDTDTEAARKAGIAWGEDSGLDWNEKYAKWIASMELTSAQDYGKTFTLTTAHGVELPAPVLECAETSVFLRVAFAAWYRLPFFISAWSSGGMIHFGHFGVVRNDGVDTAFPSFKSRYADHTDIVLDEDLGNWPSDSSLKKRFLTTLKDDLNSFLGEKSYSGAYFDRIFLNKRVGHFLMIVLTYTGSIHLASTDNTFNLKARAVREGDTLLKRWKKTGIGHTMVVKTIKPFGDDEQFEVELVSGSMPRRQPKLQTPGSSKMSFTDERCGGEGENYDGEEYARLGGGIKRWRIARVISGRWRNIVGPADRDVFISLNDLDAIRERPALFESILSEQTAEQKVQTLVTEIELKRQHLRTYPASCSARASREALFTQLYDLTSGAWQWESSRVDSQYRILEDYVFADLAYDKSRTCCWNSTTSAMYEIVMDYNQRRQDDAAANEQCVEPVVFMMKDGGYYDFMAHAESLGRLDEWVAWSADEDCPQAETVQTDTLIESNAVLWCEQPSVTDSQAPSEDTDESD